MQFQVTAVRLDQNTIVADVHSNGYDAQVRYDKEVFEQTMEQNFDNVDWEGYWQLMTCNDKGGKSDIDLYIRLSPYLLHSLRDAIRLKEIEAIIYDIDEDFGIKQADHLHSLITQYGEGRVETEGLK